jgi:transketolase
MATSELEALAARIRRRVLEFAAVKQVHIGAALSVADILAVLYGRQLHVDPKNPHAPDRDRLILSKGHAALALYGALAERGFLSQALLDGFGEDGNDLAGHPVEAVPGVEAATGALGHGLPVGAGCALAAKLDGHAWKTVVVLGDGELDEGSVWEAAMFAAHRRLDNLIAVVDRNGYQQEGPTAAILDLEPLAAKWAAFGWHVLEADGHDVHQLAAALDSAFAGCGRPVVVLARTVKGKGVPFMENDASWHMGQLQGAQLEQALAAVVPG